MAPRKIRSLALAAIFAVSGVAEAAPSAAEREAARRFMDEGKARLKANEAARAIESFQKAHEIMHVPTTGIALARAHLTAGHLVEARDVAVEVGRMPHDAGDPAVFDAARKQARELDAQLKARIPTVRVRIKGGAPSRVAVDDVEIALASLGEPVAVNPGTRVFSAKGPEGEARGELEIAEREAKEIELTLAAAGGVARSPAAKAPADTSGAPTRKVAGFGNDDGDLRPAGERTALSEVLMYGGFGVGILGLGVGGVTGAMTFSRASDVDPRCENDICAPEAKGDLDAANTLATVSTIAFAVGGAGVVLGVVGYLLPRRPASAKPRVGLAWDWTARPRASAAPGAITIGPAGSGIGGTF
ncbi:MAG: hypothetical protein KF764_03565 [Labilithrix sp.]|nr:hypothetical protein [Labilithrix sp.]MBX3221119.1 hypothetical protein [Labilithrix sp.]